jgi:hypothetical protein
MLNLNVLIQRLKEMTLNVSVGSHSWIAAGAEPDTHQFNVTICL